MHLAPFAYSGWLYMVEPPGRADIGRRIFYVFGHWSPASGSELLTLFMTPGHGQKGTSGQLAIKVGRELHEPDKGFGIFNENSWVHFTVVVHRKSIELYVNGERIYSGLLSETNMYTRADHGRQHGICFIGIPPPDLMPAAAASTFFSGFLYNFTYHDDALTEEQVAAMCQGSRHGLPSFKQLQSYEEGVEIAETSCVFPNFIVRPSILHWMICSDLWPRMEQPIQATLASRKHMKTEGISEFQKDALKSLRKHACELYGQLFDADTVRCHRRRQFAVNTGMMKVVPPIIRVHANDESFTLEAKIRFRSYANLEEGAKDQTILACHQSKTVTRDTFRFVLEVLAKGESEVGPHFHAGHDESKAWYLAFYFRQQGQH
jgi:hypothetical protein